MIRELLGLGKAAARRVAEPPISAMPDAGPLAASSFPAQSVPAFGEWPDFNGYASRVKALPRVTAETASRHLTVFSAANVIAQDIAKVPVHLVRKKSDGTHERLRDHPAYEIVRHQSAPGIPAAMVRDALQFTLLLRGNAYGHAMRDGAGRLESLEPIAGTVGIYGLGRERFYEFTDAGGQVRRTPARDVLHLRYRPLDGWLGRSPLSVAAEGFGLALAEQEFAARHVAGRGSVRAVIEGADGSRSVFDDAEKAAKWAKQLRNQFDDPDASGIPVLPTGRTVKSFGLSPADAQLLEQRKLSREMIGAAFRVPPAKLGIHEGTQKSTAEQQAIDYVTDCLLTWATIWEECYRLTLLTARERADGLRFVFNLDALLRAGTVDRFNALAKAVGGPFFTANDARQIEGLAPLKEGEAMYPPPNMTRKAEAEEGDK